MSIARAIDVGHGLTKYSVSDGRTNEDSIECQMMPSLAPISNLGYSDVPYCCYETVLVDGGRDENLRRVGPDARLHMPGYSYPILLEDFSKDESYLALMRGAMHYMKVDHIDYLAVGLPVDRIPFDARSLKERLIGAHRLPQIGMADQRQSHRFLEVKNVCVFPSCSGAFYDYCASQPKSEQRLSGMSLVIDAGYFSLNWAVICDMDISMPRSGTANHCGLVAMYSSVLDRVIVSSRRGNENFPVRVTESVLNRLDRSLRQNSPFVFNGQCVDVHPMMSGIRRIVDGGLWSLSNGVGSPSDLNRVILVGGAAGFYKEAIETLFQGLQVCTVDDPIHSIVRGLQKLANELVK